MLELGSIVGRIRIDRPLGAGGMAFVFAGTHLDLHQEVAVKVLRDDLAQDTVIVERFLREARAVARLRTEHVCRVFDVGRLASGAPYIVMELLAGSDLGSLIAHGPLPVPVAVDYILQACVALAEAHAAGIVHRDLKPANLFAARRDGRTIIKVLDFGIAKAATAAEARLTGTAATIGTPAFMSPEQIKSARDVDARTDIWALGVTLYQLVSGRLPFYDQRLADIAIKVMTAPPAPLDVEPRLHAIVWRCLDKEPERRYASIAELVGELAALQPAPQPEPQPAPQPAPSANTSPPLQTQATMAPSPPAAARSRRGLALAVIGGIVVLGGVVAVIAVVGGGSSRGKPADAPLAPPPRDAAVIADAARAIDAAPPPADAAAPPADAAAPPADAAAPPHAGENPFLALPGQRERMEKAMKGIDRTIAQFESNPKVLQSNPTALESSYAGAASLACMLGDGAKAARYYAKVTEAKNRETIARTCEQAHVTLPR